MLRGRVWSGIWHADEARHASHVDDNASFARVALLVLVQHHPDLLLHAQEGALLVDVVHKVQIGERGDMEWHESA